MTMLSAVESSQYMHVLFCVENTESCTQKKSAITAFTVNEAYEQVNCTAIRLRLNFHEAQSPNNIPSNITTEFNPAYNCSSDESL